jgi:hypothetical protein
MQVILFSALLCLSFIVGFIVGVLAILNLKDNDFNKVLSKKKAGKEFIKQVGLVMRREKTTITSPSKIRENSSTLSSLDDNNLII